MQNRLITFLLLTTFVAFCQSTFAQETQSAVTEQSEVEPAADIVDTAPLQELGSDYQNSIPLLQNRFRIDYEVDELTMVFFRRYGSAPIVLVQPDGSKIFSGQADGEDLFWFDAETYDMVSIKNPTPGPWQAVGQVLPESRIMVISDIRLHADPLPDIIFSGEILKQTAYLTNAGEPIDFTGFRDVVELTIDFESTNDPNYDNFGADSEQIARFEDNGMGMDEAPLDGVFTGQFNLGVVPGKWTPVFLVRTPLFSREQVGEPIRLLPNPISFAYELDGGGDGYHKLLFDVGEDFMEFVDRESLLIDGKVRFPNGDIQAFSLTEQLDGPREHLVVNYEYGVFRVNITVFGKTSTGRDFILDVPELSFLSQAPEILQAEEALAEETAQQDGTEQGIDENSLVPNLEAMMPVEPVEEEMSTMEIVVWALVVNLTILVIGGGIMWFIMRDKNRAEDTSEVPQSESADDMDMIMEDDKKASGFSAFISKVTGIFKKKPAQAPESAAS